MIQSEILDRSPARIIDKALGGKMNPGELGIVASKRGVGKTSVLVQIAIDCMLQNKAVVHISFNQQASYVMEWYEDIFAEIAQQKNLGDVSDVKNEFAKHRVILNFNQEVITIEKMAKTLRALASSGINQDYVIIDGLNFNKLDDDDLKKLKEFAAADGNSIWCSYDIETSDDVVPAKVADQADILTIVSSKQGEILLEMTKLRDSNSPNVTAKLDSKTLLIQ
jgi:molybdopterin-guanine dinucleotide biosynthesis protein